MAEKMNLEEFADKVEWEGGLYEAVTEYGLSHNNLSDEVPEIVVRAIRDYVEAANRLSRMEDALNDLIGLGS